MGSHYSGSDTSSIYSSRSGSFRSSSSGGSVWSTSPSQCFVYTEDLYGDGYYGIKGAVTRNVDTRDDRRVRFASHFLSGPFAQFKPKKHGHSHGRSHGHGSKSSSSSSASSVHSSSSSRKHRPSRPPSVAQHHHYGSPPPPPPPPPGHHMRHGPPPPPGFEGGFIDLSGGPPRPPPPQAHDPMWSQDAQWNGPEGEIWE